MNQKNLFTRSALAAAVALISSNVSAAGFQLNEYSAAALGRSFSGEGAVADNASVGSRNPAAMTLFDRPSFSGGFVYVDPDVNISGTSPISGRSTDANNIAPSEWIPNIHFIMPLNEQWAIGASGTSNYGLATEFNDDYPAGSLGGQTDLKTANLNLSTAYRLNENFSFGLGFNAVYADAKIVRHLGEVGPLSGRPANTEVTRMEGKEWGYGWNAGVLYEVDKENRYSFTYRSKVKIDFDGDFSNQLPPPRGTGGNTIPGALTLNLPEVWEVSGYNKVAPQWAIHYSMAYTSWSQFQELKATGTNGQTLFEKHEGFHDAYRIALGTTYYYDDNWTFRTGIAFDDSPVPADNRTISIPDQDRFWISAGTTYAFNKDASVDVGISYMHGQSVHITEKTPAAVGGTTYQFDSKGTALLYGVNFNYAF